ncbi:unnamed protein product [Peronospora belbahrii]|uniref:PRELI/MSF1 domain-containing protein n=1 Tax=Peronospora belbahrii TaxID=622444 RepID=A0ABN8D0Z3_9STRA|nr:unnamed protein product [Peronospora belbahrii]
MEEIAALLSSSTTKQRLAGITGLLAQLRRQKGVVEPSATLITHILQCLRDHNSKITMGALEILELLLAHVSENTLPRSSWKLLWLSLMERLGDNKLPVREKAVHVIVEVSIVLDVSLVLEKLQLCMKHKNWRTREQSLHAIWRCLEKHKLFKEKQDELLDDVLKLLEDSSKDVRNAAMTTLEKFYVYIGPSLLTDLQDKSIRAGHMATLEERFEQIPLYSQSSRSCASVAQSHDNASTSSSVAAPGVGLPETLSSMLSSYDLQASSSSSSSVARYLESVRNRTFNEAKAAAVSADGERSSSQEFSASNKVAQGCSSFETNSDDISDKEIQKQIGMIFDKLQLDNDWDKRVVGLKSLQELTNRCAKASNRRTAISSLSRGLRLIRERLCQQVIDLRSSVSREACETIQTLAKTLRDEFNAHAEICLGNLLKSTYVTIQVISTAADATIQTMIKSTSNGYARVIPKLVECAKSRNHVLRYNAVCYLTLALQQWSISFLSKHSDIFVPIMPVILRDALGDVRAQSRKCYWSFHHLFPNEAESIFARLDGSTQKKIKDDTSRYTAKAARQTDYSSLDTAVSQNNEVELARFRSTNASQPPVSTSAPANLMTFSDNQPRGLTSEEAATEKLPRRVLGGSSSENGLDGAEDSTQTSRMLAQRPMRVGLAARPKPLVSQDVLGVNETKKSAAMGPVRVRNAPNLLPIRHATDESIDTSRQEFSTTGQYTNSKPVSKVQRVQRAVEAHAPASMEIDESEVAGPKRLPIASMPSLTASNALSSKTNIVSRGDSGDNKQMRVAPVKMSETSNIALLPDTDQLEEALRNFESRSWSTRLEAAEYIGKLIQKRDDQIANVTSGDRKVDGRIMVAFIKHLGDAHYRVAQGVLKNFLPLLKLLNSTQLLLPHLKTILPKLFQKFVDTKESIRMVAKENLEHIASTVDSSSLTAVVISMLGDGSNMKVKAAMCHYLRELLPKAEGYMKNGANNSHMRSFLLKIALLVDADVPVSVSSACGELVSVSAQHYSLEMEAALGLLPPSKRLVVAKILKSKKIVLGNIVFHKPPLSSAPQSTQSQDVDSDTQNTEHAASKPERSRKRPKSPNMGSFGSARQNSQKRINTTSKSGTEDQNIDVQTTDPAGSQQTREEVVKAASSQRSLLSCALPSPSAAFVDKNRNQVVEDMLDILEQTNTSEMEVKHALYKTLHGIKITSSETWDRCFQRLLLLLLDGAIEKNINALKVLQTLVLAQPCRAQVFSKLLLERLIDALGDQSDVASHLIERILHDVVSKAKDYEQILSILITLLSSKSPPVLQVILRLVTLCLQQCEQCNSTYVFEETVCDPHLKRLVLKSTNLSLRSVATVEETCVYSVYPNNDHKTLYEAKAKVTAFVPLLNRKLETFSVSRGAETAAKGIRAVEEICSDIFQGTFQPVFCETAQEDSMAIKTTEEIAALVVKWTEKK